MGKFPYGKHLRSERALDAVKDRNFSLHTRQMLATYVRVTQDDILNSGSFEYYVAAIHGEQDFGEQMGVSQTQLARDDEGEPPADGRVQISNLRLLFAKLVTGQKGLFSKVGPSRKVGDLAKTCADLWPLWPQTWGEVVCL